MKQPSWRALARPELTSSLRWKLRRPLAAPCPGLPPGFPRQAPACPPGREPEGLQAGGVGKGGEGAGGRCQFHGSIMGNVSFGQNIRPFPFLLARWVFVLANRRKIRVYANRLEPAVLSHLRSRVWLLIAVAVLPLVVFSLISYRDQRAAAIAAVEKDIWQFVRAARIEESHAIDQSRDLLRIMARSDDLRDLDPPAAPGLPSVSLETQADYVNFGGGLADGRMFCNAFPSDGPVDFSDRLWWREALAKRELSIGGYLVDRVSGKPAVSFGYPLFGDDGAIRAVLFATLSFKWLERVAQAIELPPGWIVQIVDKKGIILARYPDPETWRGKPLPEAPLAAYVASSPPRVSGNFLVARGVCLYGLAPLKSSRDELYLLVGAPASPWRRWRTASASIWRSWR